MTLKSTTRTLRNSSLGYVRCLIGVLVLGAFGLLGAGCASMPGTMQGVPSRQTSGPILHVVREGDTLGGISKQYTGSVENYQRIADFNGLSNANRLYVGQQIKIPSSFGRDAGNSFQARQSASPSGSATRSSSTDRDRTIGEGALVGTGVGALAGSAMCKKDRTKCGLVGSVVGAIAGVVAGTVVADKKEAYVSAEDLLDQEIAHTRAVNEQLSTYSAKLSGMIGELEKQARSLKRRYQNKAATRADVAKQRKQISSLLRDNQQVLNDANRAKQQQVELYDAAVRKSGPEDPRATKLHQQIAVLEQNIAKLEDETRRVAAIDESLSV